MEIELVTGYLEDTVEGLPLEFKVNKALQEGWRLVGSPLLLPNCVEAKGVQMLVKYSAEEQNMPNNSRAFINYDQRFEPQEEDYMDGLTKLGDPGAKPERTLEVFSIGRTSLFPVEVEMECTEFTCRCPVTNQPDWARITIKYTPKHYVIESKSLKLYLETFRDEGIFHEHLAQDILTDVVRYATPVDASVTVHFNTRGGIAISATASWDGRNSASPLNR